MSDKEKMSNEDWKKLEDQAYFELCQIIAEAMQLQDKELLDYRIASWKNKYKKLLDRPSTNSKSDFKKRIEFLLNQYYSSVTQYILKQLQKREQEKLKNQSKAMRELHNLIRDTNDLTLLNKKIDKWKKKYPISRFLNMYQKRISTLTREKNIEANTFDQESAFKDLVDITKKIGTIDELNKKVDEWEKKYSINNKFKISDFKDTGKESQVNRFVSEDFLTSIARDDSKPEDQENKQDNNINQENDNSYSSLSVQKSAYLSLLSTSKSLNNVDEMFKWVYKYNNVKFNDKYKELILRATNLNYSPVFLNKMERPNINVLSSSLSFDEYQNISDIKRYAIISYFNLLLPPEKSKSNNFFNKSVLQILASKSDKAKNSENQNSSYTSIEDLINSGIEISLKDGNRVVEESIEESAEIATDRTVSEDKSNDEKFHKINPDEIYIKNDNTVKENKDNNVIIELRKDDKQNNTTNILNASTIDDERRKKPEGLEKQVDYEDVEVINGPAPELSETMKKEIPSVTEETTLEKESKAPAEEEKEEISIKYSIIENAGDFTSSNPDNSSIEKDLDENYDYDKVIVFSPLFFATINRLSEQAEAIDKIDDITTQHIEHLQYSNDKNINLDRQFEMKKNI